jgi:D-glycero-D-manno-heptose 1,7-bisphosphate phosphatase
LDFNYLDLCLHRCQAGTLAALALRHGRPPLTGRAVRLVGGRVTGFMEPVAAGVHLVSGGIAVMDRAVLDRTGPREKGNAAFFASLAAEGELAGRVYDGPYCQAGAVVPCPGAPDPLGVWRRRPAVFFDRDGVLNVDHGFVGTTERWEWVPGAPEAVKRCNDLGYLVIVFTNQSGIARGYFSQDRFWRLMDWANEQLRDQGAHLDAVYACPHHPTDGLGEYRRDCDCRKPGPGLIDRALAEWDVDIARSVVVGDSGRDLEAGAARGIAGRLFPGGNLLEFMEFLPGCPEKS